MDTLENITEALRRAGYDITRPDVPLYSEREAEALRFEPDEEHGDLDLAGMIYLYAYPRDRENARVRRSTRWPFVRRSFLCKIGRTRMETVGDRIRQQLRNGKAALPEWPHVYATYRCEFEEQGERYIHNRLRARQFIGGAGTEWFYSSPEEVFGLWRSWLQIVKRGEAARIRAAGNAGRGE
jgi:hypothetical protein